MTTTNGPISRPPAASQTGGSNSGCLRGCLITLGVFVVVFILGVVLTLTAGRAYVVRHLPEWETRYPLLAVGVDLLSLREELSAQQGVPPGGGRQEGSNDRSLLPADVAVHPDPRSETYNIAPDQVTAFQSVRASQDEVATTLRDAWVENGWALSDERTVEGARLFIWQKDARVCRVDVVASTAGAGASRDTEVWLRCSTQAE